MKKGYIARPKKIEKTDDLEELTIIKNRYAEEYDLPRYIAFDEAAVNVPMIHYSGTQYRWFFTDDAHIEKIGCGNTIDDAIDDLLNKINTKITD